MTIRHRYSMQCDKCKRTASESSFDMEKVLAAMKEKGWTVDYSPIDGHIHLCPFCTRWFYKQQRIDSTHPS